VVNQIFNLASKKIKNIMILNNTIINIPDLGSLNITLKDFNLHYLTIDTNKKLVDLKDNNTLEFSLTDVTGELNASYYYIFDPPVIADVGDFYWIFRNTSFST